MSQELMEGSRAADSSRVIGYEKAEIISGIVPDTYFLVVSGQAPCLNMDVALQPLIYIVQPEYWGIEVVGTLPGGLCLTALKPFSVSIPLGGITGTKGVEVIGANKTDRFDI